MSICDNLGPSLGTVNLTKRTKRRRLTAASSEEQMNQEGNVHVVSVVWGIEINDGGPLDLFADRNSSEAWSFDNNFDPLDPKAQRSIRNVVVNLPAELQVIHEATWLHDFEWWLDARGGFPSRSFHDDMRRFLEKFPNNTKNFLQDPVTSKVLALKIDFRVGISSKAAVGEILALKEKWDEYVENTKDVSSARAGTVFHSSHLWVKAEAQSDIIRSTLVSIFISVLCGFLAIVLFTKSCCLALFVSAV